MTPLDRPVFLDKPALPSDRRFGLTMAAVCALVTAAGWWRGRPTSPGLPALALVFTLAALTRPRLLAPLNSAWARLGALLNHVVSPLVLGVVFFGLMTPYAVVLRLRGRDLLRRRADPTLKTYWITRQDALDPAGFRRQF